METSSSSVCDICDESLSEKDSIVVHKRRIETFIKASIARDDKKNLKWSTKETLTIHKKCNNTYAHSNCIKSAVGKNTDQRRTRSSLEAESNKECLYCGEDASDSFMSNEIKRKPPAKRDCVYTLTEDGRASLIEAAGKKLDDDCARKVLERLRTRSEKRYHNSCSKKFLAKLKDENSGESKMDEVAKVVEFISNYLNENSDSCQFSLYDILEKYEGTCPTRYVIISNLEKKLGDEIIISYPRGKKKSPIISFRNMGEKILSDHFYESKNADQDEEHKRLIVAAAKIIKEQTRTRLYDNTTYNSPQDFLGTVESDIPSYLALLLDTLVCQGKRGNPEKWERTKLSIAHILHSAMRPQCFTSCLKLGLAIMLHKKYGSRDLLDVLSSLGLAASYADVVKFETSILMNLEKPQFTGPIFSQFVFDNADKNINTLDGHNTFHAMGGIHCVTPSDSVSPFSSVPKCQAVSNERILQEPDVGYIQLKHYQKADSGGLVDIKIENLNEKNPIPSSATISPTDFLWLYAKSNNPEKTPGWNGFMEKLTQKLDYKKSRIFCLPFVNSPPSNYDTIYTVLTSGIEMCKSLGHKYCVVTFDQPLYHKARDIIASSPPDSDLKSIILRLGPFHTIMSFLGAIGYIMDGSGLKEVLCLCYAELSADKMMGGHAYSRAIRGHFLIHFVLGKIILSSIDLTEEERKEIEDILMIVGDKNLFQIIKSDSYQNIVNKFTARLNQLKENGPTAKLWVQYFEMISLVKQFLEAERSGNWPLHLESMQKMLPYFHATGHFLYAKSGQLYLQDMLKLRDDSVNLSGEELAEYQQLTTEGFFSIRRSDKYWCGVSSDMTIEQYLMRQMKSSGGLTHGRGMTESVLSKWVLTMPIVLDISEAVSTFCGTSFGTTEQHVDARASRISRDNADLEKFSDWFTSHPPFEKTQSIASLSSGLLGDEKINCHKALEIGLSLMNEIVGGNFRDVKFQRKKRVLSLLSVTSSIKMNSDTVTVDPLTIFQRICVLKKTDEQLKLYFIYELAPYPLSLFDEFGMRKTVKSKLYDYFNPVEESSEFGRHINVVDGGFLLHRIAWQQNTRFSDIFQQFTTYAERYYEPNSVIVFDGYPDKIEERGTKSVERLRRGGRQVAPEVNFNELMSATMSSDKFLSNEKNKKKLIAILSEKLREKGFEVLQAQEDADTLIINTAIEKSTNSDYDTVIVVGEDIDLLVLLTALAPNNEKVFLKKPSKGKAEYKIFSSNSFMYPNLRKYITFIHAFSGCDTTSAMFRQGKGKLIKLLEKRGDLMTFANQFMITVDEPVHEFIAQSGQKICNCIYGAKKGDSFFADEFRYLCFKKSSARLTFNLASIPPSPDALAQHSYRAFYQIQLWKGVKLNPEEWGWKKTGNGLQPITTLRSAAPLELLTSISCKCTQGCSARCTCRKMGLHCSDICTNCCGRSCSNLPAPDLENDLEENPTQLSNSANNFLDDDIDNGISYDIQKINQDDQRSEDEIGEDDEEEDGEGVLIMEREAEVERQLKRRRLR